MLFRITEKIVYHPTAFINLGSVHFEKFFSLLIYKSFCPPLFSRFQHQDSIRSVADTFYIGYAVNFLASRFGRVISRSVGNLGYFSAKLKARPVMDAKEIHAQSIYFDNVNFRPSSSFRKKVRGFVEKAKSGFAHSAEVPVEERRRRLERFLDERPMIRRKEYTQLTGLLKNKALNELNGWVKEGVLDTIGSGSHKIYVRANTKKE